MNQSIVWILTVMVASTCGAGDTLRSKSKVSVDWQGEVRATADVAGVSRPSQQRIRLRVRSIPALQKVAEVQPQN